MNFFHRITAFFKFRGEKRAVEVTAAEIKEDMVYLHPEDDPGHTYRIRANSIAIMLNPEESIEDDDFYIINNDELKKKRESGKTQKDDANSSKSVQKTEQIKLPDGKSPTSKKRTSDTTGYSDSYKWEDPRFKKKKVSISMYPHEYEKYLQLLEEFRLSLNLGKNITSEFFLACLFAAKKQA